MRTLTIKIERKFKLFKWLFGENKTILNRKAPEKWEELSRKQFKKLVNLFYMQELTEHERKLKTAMVLYRLTRLNLFLFDAEQMQHLVKKCQWIFEESLTAQLIPSFKIKGKRYYGPGADLSGYVGYEFIHADTYFMKYMENQNMEMLEKMISVLYRPENEKLTKEEFEGDYRIPFTPYKAKQELPNIKKLPTWMKYAILMYYMGCRQGWENLHKNLFSQESESDAKENEGWSKIMLRIAGKEFGDYDKTVAQPIHTLFSKMDSDVKDFKEMERKNRANKNKY